MNKLEAVAFIQSGPDDDDYVVIRPRERRKKQSESESDLRFRVPRSSKEAFHSMLELVGARIGNQATAVKLDFVIAIVMSTLENEQ